MIGDCGVLVWNHLQTHPNQHGRMSCFVPEMRLSKPYCSSFVEKTTKALLRVSLLPFPYSVPKGICKAPVPILHSNDFFLLRKHVIQVFYIKCYHTPKQGHLCPPIASVTRIGLKKSELNFSQSICVSFLKVTFFISLDSFPRDRWHFIAKFLLYLYIFYHIG